MLKYVALLAAVVVIVALAIAGKPASPSGSWKVDARHSDAWLSTNGTTDFGKSKTDFTLGFTRVNGTVNLDTSAPANSAFDFRMYPAGSMAPPIDEDGKVRLEWFTHQANTTLMCFHSKGTQPTADGRLKTTGQLVLTRVDRNVELTPSEAYAGPVYGPPIIHRVSHEATFVFDIQTAGMGGQKDGAIVATGATKVEREDFPQLLKAVVAMYWPPVIQDKNCDLPVNVGEGYTGAQCTGTFLMAQPIPEGPVTIGGEEAAGASGFNAIAGDRLKIMVRMRLTPAGAGAVAGN